MKVLKISLLFLAVGMVGWIKPAAGQGWDDAIYDSQDQLKVQKTFDRLFNDYYSKKAPSSATSAFIDQVRLIVKNITQSIQDSQHFIYPSDSEKLEVAAEIKKAIDASCLTLPLIKERLVENEERQIENEKIIVENEKKHAGRLLSFFRKPVGDKGEVKAIVDNRDIMAAIENLGKVEKKLFGVIAYHDKRDNNYLETIAAARVAEEKRAEKTRQALERAFQIAEQKRMEKVAQEFLARKKVQSKQSYLNMTEDDDSQAVQELLDNEYLSENLKTQLQRHMPAKQRGPLPAIPFRKSSPPSVRGDEKTFAVPDEHGNMVALPQKPLDFRGY